jgi:hypothetical protein
MFEAPGASGPADLSGVLKSKAATPVIKASLRIFDRRPDRWKRNIGNMNLPLIVSRIGTGKSLGLNAPYP